MGRSRGHKATERQERQDADGRRTLTYGGEFRAHWPNLVGACFGMALGSSLNHYMTSMFGPAMIADLGWSKADFALVGSLPLMMMVAIPLVGRFIDRFGTRPSAIAGFIAIPLAFVAMAAMSGSIIEYFAIYTVLNIFGMLTTGMVFCRVVVERFDIARGMALSIVMSAPPLAGAIAAPIMGAIIAQHGWRIGYVAMAAIAAVGGLLAVAFMGRSPRSGDTPAEAHRMTRAELAALLRNPTLVLILAGMFLVNLPQVFASSQLKLMVMDSGVTDNLATWMVSLYAGGVIVGRFITGLALDRVSPHLVAIAGLGLPAIGYLIFASPITATAPLIFAIVVVGLAQGAEGDIGAYLLARRFDMKNFSFLFSLMTMMIGLGSAIGSLMLSVTLRLGHGYATFLLVSVVATLIGTVFFGMTGRAAPDRARSGSAL